MCLPAAMIGVIGTVVSAGASIFSGISQASAYDQQAKATERNATLVGEQGEFKARQLKKQNKSTLANITASFAAAGVAPNEAIIAEQARELELNAEAIRFGTEINQENLKVQANIQRGQGASALVGGFINAASTVIGSPLGKQGIRNISNGGLALG